MNHALPIIFLFSASVLWSVGLDVKASKGSGSEERPSRRQKISTEGRYEHHSMGLHALLSVTMISYLFRCRFLPWLDVPLFLG